MSSTLPWTTTLALGTAWHLRAGGPILVLGGLLLLAWTLQGAVDRVRQRIVPLGPGERDMSRFLVLAGAVVTVKLLSLGLMTIGTLSLGALLERMG